MGFGFLAAAASARADYWPSWRGSDVALNNLPDDECNASPVISSGRIYLRGSQYLYAVQAKGK